MKYNPLGQSSLLISELGFGCMSLQNQSDTKKLLHQAFDGGINYFDTADLYNKGENETWVGNALKDQRDKVIIATKVGNEWRKDGSGWDWNPHKAYILKAVEESLVRLQTDYIDYYQLHGGTIDDPIDETIEAFELLLMQGKIRAYGISSIRPNVIREYVNRSNISGVMMQYSLLDRRPEESCLDLLATHKISVLVRGALAKGLLAGKPAEDYLNYSEDEVQKMKSAMLEINENSEVVAIDYVLQHPPVASTVVGIRTIEQLDMLLKLKDRKNLNNNEIQQLSEVIRMERYSEHR